jgi:prepilin-type N-terminal cleavage/methylation domain-containing protein/prepilin-type processing-associated H-X9-DG protein
LAELRPRSAPAFTLIELLVVIAIIAILAAVAFSTGKSWLNSAKEARALSNLRQIGATTFSYVAENNGRLPLGVTDNYTGYFGKTLAIYSGWTDEYGKRLPDIFYDPTLDRSVEHGWGSLGVNWSIVLKEEYCRALYQHTNGIPLARIPSPSKKVIVSSATHPVFPKTKGSWYFDGGGFAQTGLGGAGWHAYPEPRYSGKAGCLFADGHVEKLDVKNMDVATRRRHFTLDE